MSTNSEIERAKRVLNLYFILCERARDGGRLLTYGEGAKRVGINRAQFCMGPLNDVEVLAAWITSKEELPALWILLRRKEDMLPGPGSTMVKREKLGEAHASVAAYDWDTVVPPTVEELVVASQGLRAKPDA